MKDLVSLTKEEICNLSNDALCERMDAVLLKILYESYTDHSAIQNFPGQNIQKFFKTKKIQSLSQENQRKALRKCFEYLVQHEYLSRTSGWINEAIYGLNYDENHSWLSPRIQSINCATNHIKIVGSAVAFERMMDLLYIIETGKSLPKSKNKSKYNNFKSWLLKPYNTLYFLHQISFK